MSQDVDPKELTEAAKRDFNNKVLVSAQARHTKTPIRFKELGPDDEGNYERFSPIEIAKLFLAAPGMTGDAGKGLITLNPNATDFNLNRDTRHEETHALLNSLPSKWYQDPQNVENSLATSTPGYQQIAQKLVNAGRGGFMPQEVPAYAAAGNPEQTGAPQNWMDEYIGKLKDTLAKINPQLGQTLGLIQGQGASQ